MITTHTPTGVPTEVPTELPTEAPTEAPTEMPTEAPTEAPTTEAPTTQAPTTRAQEESHDPPLGRGSPSKMRLDTLEVENRCNLPVYFFEGGPRGHPFRIEAKQKQVWTGAAGEPELRIGAPPRGTGRVSFAFTKSDVSGNTAVVEMGQGFAPLGEEGSHWNFNLINQHGFIDMNIEMALWDDHIGGVLACEDSWIRTSFSMDDCGEGGAMADRSGIVRSRSTPDGESYSACVARFRPSGSGVYPPESCTTDFASYVNDRSRFYFTWQKEWKSSARSTGYSHYHFDEARFADGLRLPATLTGRDKDGKAINFECFEAPCLEDTNANAQCKENGQVSVGVSGFNVCNARGNLEEVGVMQIVLCPEQEAEEILQV